MHCAPLRSFWNQFEVRFWGRAVQGSNRCAKGRHPASTKALESAASRWVPYHGRERSGGASLDAAS
eukprot:4341678-Alexandrium_andersonii.AAC.1